ncbi:MAG: type II toxin-antitoxin system prevent-host-death family antitoxin [Chitinophagaceae bacterium]|nr:type II toxin-antitoxin system prevent-host-death family antitoxin [Anaerolineae bacterium]
MMTMRSVDIHEIAAHWSELIQQVRDGQEIILTDGEEPIAKLVPATAPRKPRTPDMFPGTWMSEDFNDPLPDDF